MNVTTRPPGHASPPLLCAMLLLPKSDALQDRDSHLHRGSSHGIRSFPPAGCDGQKRGASKTVIKGLKTVRRARRLDRGPQGIPHYCLRPALVISPESDSQGRRKKAVSSSVFLLELSFAFFFFWLFTVRDMCYGNLSHFSLPFHGAWIPHHTAL